jgi:DNA polymerase III subunit delta'
MGYLEDEDLIGHAALRGFLSRSIANKRHHAFLFAGPAHLGKDTVARAAVADELGRPVKDWQELESHPDVHVLAREEGDKNIGIAALRGFIGHFSRSSLWGGRKVGVICGAHELSIEAANALLKTLEEPSGGAILILIADALDRLPETVRSRCQLVRFLPVPADHIKDGLVRRGFAAEAAEDAAAFASGRPGLAMSHAADAATRDGHAKRAAAFAKIAASSISARIAEAGNIAAKAETAELTGVLDAWIGVVREALSAKISGRRASAMADSYADGRSVEHIAQVARAAVKAKRMLSENVNPRLVFENLALTI